MPKQSLHNSLAGHRAWLCFSLLSLLVGMSSLKIQAQEFLTTIQSWNTEDGLSHRDVFDLHQDEDGFLWVATRNGLNRFDGVSFQWWTKEANGLVDNQINQILEDDAGWLWLIRHRNWYFQNEPINICLLQRSTGKVQSLKDHFPDGLPFSLDAVTSIKANEAGHLFFGLKEGILFSYQAERGFRKYTLPIETPVKIRWVDPSGMVWGQTGEHADRAEFVFSYTPSQDRYQAYPIDYGECWTQIIGRDPAGRILGFLQTPFATKKRFTIDPQDGLQVQESKFWTQNAEAIRRDWSGRIEQNPYTNKLWFAGYPRLLEVDPQEGKTRDLTEPCQALIQAQIQSIYFDRQGLIWVGTSDGLYQISNRLNPFQSYLDIDYQNYQVKKAYSCRGIFADHKDIWINSYRGRRRIDRLTRSVDSIPWAQYGNSSTPQYAAAFPMALLKDSHGNLWFSEQALVRRAPNGEETVFGNPYLPPEDPTIWALMEDDQGNIWVGSERGLMGFNPQKEKLEIHHIQEPFAQLNQSYIYGFFQHSLNNYWIATSSGLYLWSPTKGVIDHFHSQAAPSKKIAHDQIYYVLDGGQDTLWLGTGGAGLLQLVLDKGSIKSQEQLTVTAGLLNTNIYAIYPDEFGFLWMSSDNGIIRYQRERQQIQVFLPKDGLTHHEFNRISHFQDATGRIFFGGLNGVTAFHPRDFLGAPNAFDPVLRVTGYQKYDASTGLMQDRFQQYLDQGQIVLKPGERNVRLTFALLDFRAAESIQYAWKINGLDPDWQFGEENFLRISGLPYGEYSLSVKGRNTDGDWSSNQLDIPIIVIRPFYLQFWFLSGLFFFIGALIYSFFRYQKREQARVEKLLQQRVQEQTRTIAQQADELRALDAMKSRFFANISHEIRTPLTLILAPINSLLQRRDLSVHSQQLLQTARQNGDQLVRLINQILDLSKLDSGKVSLHEEPLALYPFLRNMINSFEVLATEQQIQLSFEYQAREDIEILTDLEKLQQILNNLLSNALKFTPANGVISVHVQANPSVWTCRIQDSGTGIAEEDLPHIFDRFYQAENTLKSEKGGTGIGLAYCKELVGLLRGKIWVESIPQHGSIFYLQLPLHEVLSTREKPAVTNWDQKWHIARSQVSDTLAWQPSESKKKNQDMPLVLVVEDNSDLRKYIEYILRDQYLIETKEDGLAALEWLEQRKQSPPDLIISDIMMPKLDGFALLQRLKKDPVWKSIPVIMLTARVGIRDKVNALRTGVDDYLTKPFIEEELLARMENLLQHAHARRQWLDTEEALEESNQEVTERSQEEEQWLIQLEAIVQEQVGESSFTVEQLAQKLFISRRQLQRRIRSFTGLTPNQYIIEFRLQTAREMLENTPSQTIKSIAFKVGMRDVKYFSQQFKKRFGRLPSSYRNDQQA